MTNEKDDPARRARHSCYDQLSWRDHDGARRTGRVTADAVKAALLAIGTRGHFTVYSARTGVGHAIGWRQGLCYLANLRRGYYVHG